MQMNATCKESILPSFIHPGRCIPRLAVAFLLQLDQSVSRVGLVSRALEQSFHGIAHAAIRWLSEEYQPAHQPLLLGPSF